MPDENQIGFNLFVFCHDEAIYALGAFRYDEPLEDEAMLAFLQGAVAHHRVRPAVSPPLLYRDQRPHHSQLEINPGYARYVERWLAEEEDDLD